MPAFYAHDRFGKEVFSQLDGELKQIIKKHYRQFRIGLQGPDLFFFYRPYIPNAVSKYGNHLHAISARPFFEHAARIVRKRGRNTREYAYLLGFLCHYILDSECHPYVETYIGRSGVLHLEIEEEFEKMLLRADGKDPFSYSLAALVPVDIATAEAIRPFYERMTSKIILRSLKDLRMVKRLFTTPNPGKQVLINMAMKMTGRYPHLKGLMNQRIDNPKCRESSQELKRRFDDAVSLAVKMAESLDESIRTGKELESRLDRTFG